MASLCSSLFPSHKGTLFFLTGQPPEKIPFSGEDRIASVLRSGEVITVELGPVHSFVPVHSSVLREPVRAIAVRVPDDNSCLFHCLAAVLDDKAADGDCYYIREMIAQAIIGRAGLVSQGELGMAPAEYCKRLLQKNSWGSDLDACIAGTERMVDVRIIDVETSSCIGGVRGLDAKPTCAVYLLFSGIHFDAVLFETESGERGYKVEAEDGMATALALEVAEQDRASGRFTNMASFKLVCGDCGERLVGEKGAIKHAQGTGHNNFQEFKG
jgi:ubiquitin thioesterase OTU1